MQFRALALALPALPALGLLSACSTVEGWFGGSRPASPPPVAAAPPPPAPPPPEPAPGSLAPPGLDGRYAGTLRLAGGAGRACRPASIPASATVNGGRVALSLGRLGSAEGAIGPEGGVSLTGANTSGEGQFQNNRLTGTAMRGECRYTVSLARRR